MSGTSLSRSWGMQNPREGRCSWPSLAGSLAKASSRTVLLQELNSAPSWEKSLCPRRINLREALIERPAGTLPSACFLNWLLDEHLQSHPGPEVHKLGQQCTDLQGFPWVDLHPQNV